ARANMALRRDLDAQGDLRDTIRLEPECAIAYRLLGALAARRKEIENAAVFFREALRLDPGDREAADWLLHTDASIRPAAVAQKSPATAPAAGRVPSRHGGQPRFARGTHQPAKDAAHAPSFSPYGPYGPYGPYDERPTKPF